MNASTGPFPAALEHFVHLFNQEEFWHSHEVLEDFLPSVATSLARDSGAEADDAR